MLPAVARIRTEEVTAQRWADMERLFESRGAPHYCWCSAYRWRDAGEMDKADKKRRMRRLVAASTPVGVLAYDGDEPVGWCSVAPREEYARLERSRTMARATPPDTPTWAVLCFFVARPYRGRGVTRALLRGAVACARRRGARVVEGYPFDTAGVTSTHRGHSSAFAAAGFRQDGTRWWRRLSPARR